MILLDLIFATMITGWLLALAFLLKDVGKTMIKDTKDIFISFKEKW